MEPMKLRDEPWFDREGYPFAPHVLETPAGKLHYVDEGEGPAVLLVHGTPGWSYEYRVAIARLRRRFRVVAPDHLGFGLSDRSSTFGYTLPEHTANLEALVAHLKLDRFSLVVHDFGGPVGLPLVLSKPERLEKLVLMNTWMWPLTLDPEIQKLGWMTRSGLFRWMYRNLNFSAKVMVKSSWGKRAPLTAAHHQQYLGMFPTADSRAGTLGFLRSTYAEDAHLESLWAQRAALQQRPSMLIWGQADTFIKPLHLDRWRELLPAARLHPLDGVGHFPQDEAGDEVAGLLEDFLGS
jgi:haloalkane dehalogenase